MARAGRVLVVEESDIERREICQILASRGYNTCSAENADRAIGYLNEMIDVVLCGLGAGALSGMDLLALWKQRCPRTKFILLTGRGNVEDAVAAIKAGAYDYLSMPLPHEKLALLIEHTMEVIASEAADAGARRPGKRFNLDQAVGKSRQIQQVFAKVQRAAPVDSTVLILGENGTGKELVAHALHERGPRNKGPFVAVNVAAVPATLVESELFGHVRGAFTGATDRRTGRFEQANGGTLFIDEIGDFDLSLQPKLLRVIETLTLTPVGGQDDIHVNVRVVAATSRNLTQMMREGKFREDLYYRLNVVQIILPPLRERREDIPVLAEHFAREIAGEKAARGRYISPAVMRRFVDYAWPGNVRELHNTLESMMVLADEELLTEADLPHHISHLAGEMISGSEPSVGLTMEELERLAISRALEECGNNRTHAAERLGISVRTLQRKLHEYQTIRRSTTPGDDAMTP